VAWCGLAGVGTLGSVGVVFTSFFVTLSPSTVVIWITAYGSQETNAEARRLGVYRCLDKPLEVAEIQQIALEALEAAGRQTPDVIDRCLLVGLANPRPTCAMKILVRGSWRQSNQVDVPDPHHLFWMLGGLVSMCKFQSVNNSETGRNLRMGEF
jgi:hypothetical protein